MQRVPSISRDAVLPDHRAPSDESTRLPLGRMIILGSFTAGGINADGEGDVSVAGDAVEVVGDGAAALLARPLALIEDKKAIERLGSPGLEVDNKLETYIQKSKGEFAFVIAYMRNTFAIES